MTGRTIGLFAGPGGWAHGVAPLGVREVGIEWDEAACLTAMAAGHLRIRADVSRYPTDHLRGIVEGLLISAPCTTFSAAGTGAGKLVMEILARGIRDTLAGRNVIARCRREATAAIFPTVPLSRTVKPLRKGMPRRTISYTKAERKAWARQQAFVSCLMLEIPRWIRDCEPEWFACENVSGVAPLFELLAHLLRAHGYSTWTDDLNAADYGVPQTRVRRFLTGSKVRRMTAPPVTHCRGGSEPDLISDGLESWVSMATALEWGATDRPMVTVTSSDPRGANKGRQAIERERGSWIDRVPTGSGCPHD